MNEKQTCTNQLLAPNVVPSPFTRSPKHLLRLGLCYVPGTCSLHWAAGACIILAAAVYVELTPALAPPALKCPGQCQRSRLRRSDPPGFTVSIHSITYT